MTGPAIQLALDTRDTATAVAAAHAVRDVVDVIEAGTVLVLNDGLGAVRVLRAAFPDHPLVADIRIARAGAKFAGLAFDAGADRVTVVGEAGMPVVEGALSAARAASGEVEVELGAGWTPDDVRRWVDAGVRHVIAHRSGNGPLREDRGIADTLRRLAAIDLGPARVTLAGGINAGDLAGTGLPFDTVAIGSAIVGAGDPRAAARGFRSDLEAREVNVA
jgi:3-dehydro-L-gulonate-6-phosphate decarboxylase